MNPLTRTLAIVLALTLVGDVFAQQKRGPKRDARQSSAGESQNGDSTQAGATTPADRRDKADTKRPGLGQGGQMDPAMLVARMLKEFDADGDQKLDLQELTKLMTSMRERRQAGGPAGMRGRGGNAGKANEGSTLGKRGQGAAERQGGDKPVRPSGN